MKRLEIKRYLIKKTEKIRYKFIAFIMRCITPALYRKINIKALVNRRSLIFTTDDVLVDLRPSFRFMKKKFGGKLIKGAEIGVERGRNSKSILKGFNIEKLYLIDIWENYEGIDNIWSNINENYKYILRKFGKDKRIKIIKDYSEKAVNLIENDSLDFVYIDGNHFYEYVYQDIKLWFEKVKNGGIIAGHDVFLNDGVFGGVYDAVRDFCYENKIVFYIENPDWFFIKNNEMISNNA